MSWPQWPGAAPAGIAQPPIINPAPSVANPASNPYTPEQWAQMQHQNWQQWAQWQQQFQQWQQQYGAEYQKSMNAIAQTTVTAQPPAPYMPAPPLPAETKPPPPPDEPVGPPPPSNTAYSSNAPPPLMSQSNYSTAPPPLLPTPPNKGFENKYSPHRNNATANQAHFSGPNSNNQQKFGRNPNYNNNNRGPQGQSTNWQNQNNRNQQQGFTQFNQARGDGNKPDFGMKRPYVNPNDTDNSKRNKLDFNETNQWEGNQQKPNWDEGQRPPPPAPQNPTVQQRETSTPTKNNPEELSEAEKKFDKQFKDWQAQFQKWKEQNANHPDKDQYRQYEKKWETWRAQLLERREQMRQKRLGLTDGSPKPTADKPIVNKEADPAALSMASPKSKNAADAAQLNKCFEGVNEVIPSTNAAKSVESEESNIAGFSRPPPNLNNQPLDFKKSNILASEPPEAKSEEVSNLDEGAADFLKSATSGGIPGLDLVKEGEEMDNSQDDFATNKETESTKPDLEAISRGINSILGDQKLMNMLSLVSQNNNRSFASPAPSKPDSPKFSPAEYNQEDNDYSNDEQQEFFNFEKPDADSYHDEPGTESQSNLHTQTNVDDDYYENDVDSYEQPDRFQNEPDDFGRNFNFGSGPGSFDKNRLPPNLTDFDRGVPPPFKRALGKPMGPDRNFGMDRGNFKPGPSNFDKFSDNFAEGSRDFDNFAQNPGGINNKNSNNFGRGEPDNFDRNPGNFSKGPDGFNRGSHISGPDNFNRGPGNFNRGLDNFNKGGDNFHKGGDNFNRGGDNFNKGGDNFIKGDDNFTRGGDNFTRGGDNFTRGGDNFTRGGDNFTRGGDNFTRGGDNFNKGPNNFNRGPERFNRDSDNFSRDAGNVRQGPGNFNRGFNDATDSFEKGPNFMLDSNAFNRDGNKFNRDPDNFAKNPPNFNRNQRNFEGGFQREAGNFNRLGSLNKTPDNFNRGTSNFDGDEEFDDFNRGSNTATNFNRDPPSFDRDVGKFDNFNRGPLPSGNFNRGNANFDDDADKFDNMNRGPNSASSGNFNRGGGNFDRDEKFDNFNRGPNAPVPPGNFSRGPNSFTRDSGIVNKGPVDFNKEADHFNKPPLDFNQKNFNRNLNRDSDKFQMGFDRNQDRMDDKFNPTHNRFGRDGEDFNKGPGGFGRNSNELKGAAPVRSLDIGNRNLNTRKDEERARFPPQQNFGKEDNFNRTPQPLLSLPLSLPNEPTIESVGDPKIPSELEDSVGIWKTSNVTDYDHKTLTPEEPEIILEPCHTFDYRHKPLNRIPYPSRPKWLSDMICKSYPEFDVATSRSSRPLEFRRFPVKERFDRVANYEDRGRKLYDDRNRRNFEDRDSYMERDRKFYDDKSQKPHDDKEYRGYEERDRKSSEGKQDKALTDVGKNRNSRNSEQRTDSKVGFKEQIFPDDKELDSNFDDFDDDDGDFVVKTSTEKMNIEDDDKRKGANTKIVTSSGVAPKSNVTLIEDILSPPGRYHRAPRIVIILRGPPGSGKSFLAKLIKDKEVENGGSAPRILCLDDYFMVEQEKEVEEDGRKVKVKEMVYEFEEGMEAAYRQSLMKSFKKTITDGYFNFIVVDNINDKVKYFGEMWSFAKQNGFQVYISEMELDVQICTKRNIHGRSEDEIAKCVASWERSPAHHPLLDATSLIQLGSIPEVEMEEINSPSSENLNEEPSSMEPTSRYEPVEQWKTTSNWTTTGSNPYPQNQARKGFVGLTWKNERSRRK